MRALAVVLALLCATAQATPADAPVRATEGQPAPSDGIFIPTATAIEKAKEIRACEAKVAEFERGHLPLVVPVVLGVAAAFAAGLGLGLYLGHGSQQGAGGN